MPIAASAVSAAAEAAGDIAPQGGAASWWLIGAAAGILAILFAGKRLQPFARDLQAKLGRRRLQRALRQSKLQRLDNFILPGACDGLARVDHAVLTSAGLLCIRAMHGNGLVFGTARDPQWSAVDGVDQRRFLNPLIQNEGRAKALQRVVPGLPVSSLVVFTGSTRFSQPPADNVIHVSHLCEWLEQHQQTSTAENLDEAWLTLRAAARTDDASRRDFEAQLSFG